MHVIENELQKLQAINSVFAELHDKLERVNDKMDVLNAKEDEFVQFSESVSKCFAMYNKMIAQIKNEQKR